MRIKFFLSLTLFLIGCTCFYPSFVLEAGSTNFIKYDGNIEHLFTHCLLAYPEIAFSSSNYMRKDYDKDCLTPLEFERVLTSLHRKNYILVKPSEVYEVKNNRAYKKTLYLPKGKKPLIFSFDDVNYDSRKLGRGMVDKLILDKAGNLATSTKTKTGVEEISYNNEGVLILENFVKKHPDFSYHNAKGLLCLTGYDGILGYRTDLTSKNREEETKQVKPVIQKLKALGWEFACHSYGHYHMKRISDGLFQKEVYRWQQEVEPLIGKTEIYVYPYGEYEIAHDNEEKTEKHKLLEQAGFQLFCGVGKKYFYGYAPFHIDKKRQSFIYG